MAISDFLKRDSYIFGLLLAIIIPVVSAAVFIAVNYLLGSVLHVVKSINDAGIILLSIAMNLIAMRYYLVKFKMEKTGRALLAVTFVMGILFFLLLAGKNINIIPFN